MHIGSIIHDVIIPAKGMHDKQLSITIQNTELSAPFNASTDKVETLLNILIYDTGRNEMIVNDVKRETRAGRKMLVLTERKAHVDILQLYLKGICETITLTGEDAEQTRKEKMKLIETGDFQVLIATGQYLGEGVDIGVLDCLILAYPFSFEGKLIQYLGRVQRSQVAPIIYDYRDYRIEYFNHLFKQRNKYYRKLKRSGKLVDLNEVVLIFKGAEFYINTNIDLLSIDCLELPLPVEEFNDGVIWKLRVNGYNEEDGELLSEVIDYDYPLSKVTENQEASFIFQELKKSNLEHLIQIVS